MPTAAGGQQSRWADGGLDALVNNAAMEERGDGNTGTQTVEQGAEVIVRMAQVGADGPTGGFFNADGAVPW